MRNLPEPVIELQVPSIGDYKYHYGIYKLNEIDLKILTKCFEKIDLTDLDIEISKRSAVFSFIEDVRALTAGLEAVDENNNAE